ncbi:GNAT family acetyltransferase [Novosphingobium sp.]|uniref:GNAT family acetyltransferase n=1 Tax=Novosphingobium sp. TaxID=1874826 RepID=UPI0025F0EF8C|nr:GNAT family acetyltransferase [Novosphingobium sp.]
MDITDALPGDETGVIALWRAAGLTRPWNDPAADFRMALAGPCSTVLLACEGADLAGSVMVGFDGHRGWVYYLACHPERRGRGIGRALMAAAEDWLKVRGCPKIQLMVRGDNLAAKGFYAAIGYEVQDVVTIGKRF